MSSSPIRALGIPAICIFLGACAAQEEQGIPWKPSVSRVTASNHDASVQVAQTALTASGPVVGYAQAVPAESELSFTIPMLEDLGEYGSLTLVGKAVSIPSGVNSVYPFLVSLHDGTRDYVNLAGDCRTAGFFTSSGSQNPGCVVTWPSAFSGFDHWFQHQRGVLFLSPSVNTFPTCNWAGGSAPPSTDPACAFNSAFAPDSGFFVDGKLRSGVSYTAKYVLITATLPSVSGLSATMELTAVKKADVNQGGAIDLNVIIVGQSNIDASRSPKGGQNLNTLFSSVYDLLGQSSTGITLGSINVYEWGGDAGEAYATISSDYVGDLFSAGASLLGAETNGKAVNVYLIQQFSDNAAYLGISGAILGPPINGLRSNGVAVATYGKVASYNPRCDTGDALCPLASQDSEFVDWGATIAHEMGHFLGLNHPSEATGADHDFVLDTPICTEKIETSTRISITSCRTSDPHLINGSGSTCSSVCTGYNAHNGTFCPTRPECQFNHLMWWSSKNFSESTLQGDGNLISDQSGLKLNYNPLIQ